MFTKTYRKMFYMSKIQEFPARALDHLMFGQETRTSVLKDEIFFLKKELETAEDFLIPHIKELIEEKERLRESIKLERL